MIKKKLMEEYKERMEKAASILKEISQSNMIPRNIRRTADEALGILRDESLSSGVRAANAISTIEGVLHDPNMPSFARVKIWNAISELEMIHD